MRDRVTSFAAVVIMVALFSLVIVTQGGRELVDRIRRWKRQRAEYRSRRDAAQYITKAHAILDRELVRRALSDGPALTESELYARAFQTIRDTELRTLTPARCRALSGYCRDALREQRHAAQSSHPQKAS